MPPSESSHDAIAELAHDHKQLSVLVIAVRTALQRVQTGAASVHDALEELGDGAELLREELLTHFAREEEALFPFVDAQLPALKTRISGLVSDHDAVVRAAAELGRAAARASSDEGFALCVTTFDRFERIYAEHAKAENAFLTDVAAALDDDARATLRDLLSRT